MTQHSLARHSAILCVRGGIQRSVFRVLTIGFIVVVIVGAQKASAATTRWVNDDDPNGPPYSPPGTSCTDPGYPDISAAVAAAGSGDTIRVCDGTYVDSVTIGIPLTLLGPNAGVSWSGTRNPEAIVSSGATTFNVTNGQNVTINGFTINGDFGIYVSTSTSGTVIQDNIT